MQHLDSNPALRVCLVEERTGRREMGRGINGWIWGKVVSDCLVGRISKSSILANFQSSKLKKFQDIFLIKQQSSYCTIKIFSFFPNYGKDFGFLTFLLSQTQQGKSVLLPLPFLSLGSLTSLYFLSSFSPTKHSLKDFGRYRLVSSSLLANSH